MELEPVIFELSAPAQAHGELITKLTLRPVTGADIKACGYPFTFGNFRALEAAPDTAEPDVRFNAPVVIAMISRLAGVPTSTVKSLSGMDIFQLGWVLFGLFFQSPQTKSSNAASTSPGSGDNRPPLSLASAS